jgi:hypothetical protein
MFARADIICPQIQLGAENNIEKSRCLAQLRKKTRPQDHAGAGFSGFRTVQRRRRARETASNTVFSSMQEAVISGM